jgi:IclR family KDG regulon transcriptional repressor
MTRSAIPARTAGRIAKPPVAKTPAIKAPAVALEAVEPDVDRNPYTVSALDRALTLIEALAAHPNIGVTRIAGLTGNTKSLVFRLLYTLERRGYVRKDPATRSYALGIKMLSLGEHTRDQIDLVRVAQRHLDELVAEAHENIHLTVREGLHAICVALRESAQPLRLYAQVGRAAPLHVGGGPKVLLAYAPPDIAEAVLSGKLPAYTPATDTSRAALEKSLETIRRTGINKSMGDLDAGAFSIAAPVRDHSGTVIGALSIAGPMTRLDAATTKRHQAMVVDYAKRLSRELGWSGTSR